MRPATLARRIDRLHRHGEPLNIDAVRRRHPDLLDAAYAARPFLGWRGALERAGVRYEKIRIELARTVNCKLCGATLQTLARHLQVKHGTDAIGYRAEYPDADVVAGALRAAITRRDRRTELRALAIVRHWEPIWSPEYVLDRVAHLHRLRRPVNLEWVFEREPTLVQYAAIYHGGWDVVLRKIGLDPDDIRKHRPATHWTRAAALEALRQRRSTGLSLRHADLDRDVPGLSKALSRLFGSGRAALGRVGMRVREPARYTDGDIQALLTAVRAAARGAGSAHWNDLELLRHRFTGIVQQRFRTWGAAARAAGVPPEAVLFPHGRTRYRDAEACLAEIERRRTTGLSLMSTAVQRGVDADKALFRAGQRFFGTWHDALRAAGVPAELVARRSRRRYQDAAQVIAEIRRRRRKGLPVSPSGLQRGPDLDAALFRAACDYLGDLQEALRQAGVSPDQIPRRRTRTRA